MASSVISGLTSGFLKGIGAVVSPVCNFFLGKQAITVIQPHIGKVIKRSDRLIRAGATGGTNLVRDTGAGIERVARDVAGSGERLIRDGATGGTRLVRDAGMGTTRIVYDIGGTVKEWGENAGSWGKETVDKTFDTAQRWGDNIGRTVTGGSIACGILYLAKEATDVFSRYHSLAGAACKSNPESSYCTADQISSLLSIAGPLTAVAVLGVSVYLAPRILWRGNGTNELHIDEEVDFSDNQISVSEDDEDIEADDLTHDEHQRNLGLEYEEEKVHELPSEDSLVSSTDNSSHSRSQGVASYRLSQEELEEESNEARAEREMDEVMKLWD